MSQAMTYQVTGGCCLCGDCLSVCPVGAIILDSVSAMIDAQSCLGCGRCAAGCRTGAITANSTKSSE